MNIKMINNDTLEMLTAREQLMEDIIAIVDGELSGIISDRLSDELTTRLCDSVCKNFPTKWYSGQLPVENFYSTGQSLICPLSLAIAPQICNTNSMNKSNNPYVNTLVEMGYDRADCEMVAAAGLDATYPRVIHGRTFDTKEQYDEELADYLNGLWQSA